MPLPRPPYGHSMVWVKVVFLAWNSFAGSSPVPLPCCRPCDVYPEVMRPPSLGQLYDRRTDFDNSILMGSQKRHRRRRTVVSLQVCLLAWRPPHRQKHLLSSHLPATERALHNVDAGDSQKKLLPWLLLCRLYHDLKHLS
jgi:hypothetical protein